MLLPSALPDDSTAFGDVDDARPLSREGRRPPDIILKTTEDKAVSIVERDDGAESKPAVRPINPGT
jgi:hypothetical protein